MTGGVLFKSRAPTRAKVQKAHSKRLSLGSLILSACVVLSAIVRHVQKIF